MSLSTDEGGLAGIPWGSPALYVILSSSLIGMMGVSLISPLLPTLQMRYEVTDAAAGMIITAYTLPGIFLTPFMGLLADRVGRRRVIVPLLFIFGVAGAGISFAGSFAEILALRFVQGVGASAIVTLAVTIIGDMYDGARRNAVIGLNSSTVSVGGAAFPLLGGALSAIRWNAPFLFFGTAVFVGLLAVVALDEGDQEATAVRQYLANLRSVAMRPRALRVFTALFVTVMLFYAAILTAVPFLVSDEFGLQADRIGVLVAIVSVASAIAASQYGRLADWRAPRELIALGFATLGVSLVGLRFAPSPVAVGVALFPFGLGFGTLMPAVDTLVVTLVSEDLRAGVMGLRTSVTRIAQTIGPAAFTSIAGLGFETTTQGYRVLLLASGTLVIVAGLGVYFSLRQ